MREKNRKAGTSMLRAIYRTRMLGEVGKAIAWVVTIWHVVKSLLEMLGDKTWLK